MSTRGMIAIQKYLNGPYELYYSHYDSYPQALGAELIRVMTKGKQIEQVMLEVDAKSESKRVRNPEDAFLKVQGDLEWIYAIENLDSEGLITERTSLEIYRTSCPFFWFEKEKIRDFVFRVWGSCVDYLPDDYEAQMKLLDIMSYIALQSISAYIKVNKAQALANPK